MNLKRKTLAGLIWSFVERFGNGGVALLFNMFLARILSPSDYGVVVMPVVLFSLAGCLIDCGISDSLVRKIDLKKEDCDTAFIFSLGVGGICFILFWITSPLVANIYHTPILRNIVRVLSLNILFSSLNIIHSVILVRDVNFRYLAKISFFASVFSGIFGIVFAIKGCGVWSLVFQSILGNVIRTIGLWIYIPWRPSFVWTKESFLYFWEYGYKMTLARVLGIFTENIYPMIIGLFFSPSILGFFMKGLSVSSLFSQQATDTILKVSYPVLCKIQENENALTSNYVKLLRFSSFIIFPIMIGLVVSAESVVYILWGEQWGAVVPILRYLALGMMFYHIHGISMNVLKLKGRSDIHLYLDIVKIVVGLILLYFFVSYDIVWVSISVLILSVFSLFINIYFSGSLVHLGLKEQLTLLIPILILSSLMGGIVFCLNQFIHSIYLQLPIDIIVGCVVYLILSKMFLREMLDQLRNMLNF